MLPEKGPAGSRCGQGSAGSRAQGTGLPAPRGSGNPRTRRGSRWPRDTQRSDRRDLGVRGERAQRLGEGLGTKKAPQAPLLVTTTPPKQSLTPETGEPFSTPPSPLGAKGQPLRLWAREEGARVTGGTLGTDQRMQKERDFPAVQWLGIHLVKQGMRV